MVIKTKSSRKSEHRRRGLQRQLSEERIGLWHKLSDLIHPLVMLIWFGFSIGALVVLLSGRESMPWQLNQRVDRDITARVPFELADNVRTDQERQIAAATAPAIYTVNEAPLVTIRGKLTELLQLAKSAGDDLGKLNTEVTDKGWTLDAEALKALKGYAAEQQTSKYENLVNNLIAQLEAEYIVEQAVDPVPRTPPPTAELRRNNQTTIRVLTTELRFIGNSKYIEQAANRVCQRALPKPLQLPVAQLIVRTLQGSPDAEKPTNTALWRYDPTATRLAIEQATEKVPVYTIPKKKGDMLVRAGTLLSNAELELLKREHETYLEAERTLPELRRKKLFNQLGMAGVVLLVTMGLATYTASYQDRIFQKPARAFGLASLMLLMLLLARLNERLQYPVDSPVEFSVGFIFIAAALLTIAYNQRFAFGAAGSLSLLVTIASRGDFGLFLTLMAAMGVTVFTLKEVRTRGKVIAVGAMAGFAALFASVSTNLIASQELWYVVPHALCAGFAALAAGFVVQGIMHYFERVFGIATSMTLLEWCDASRPLLRRLAQETPGTYSHSLILSQLAEEAASAIDANGLLARVGALYHDIGKTQKAKYFVENQAATTMSRHDRLSPTMSLLIIVGHVKDGIEMARAYGLPRVLHQFIAEHHGTTIVRYFHHAATEAAAKNSKIKGKHDREISESEFRYAGPKPRSKESAILMICDSCEGAVRALSEPTPGRIESVVHQVVMDRLNDGQFDSCDITLRELNLVEQSLVKSLCAIHHARIKYPKGIAESEPAGEAESPGPADPDAKPEEPSSPTAEVARQA